MASSDFNQKVYQIVQAIPHGRVMTYGQIAALIGVPRAARAVGWALHWAVDDQNVPCQRVVNRFGGLAAGYGFGGQLAHKADLVAENIEVQDDFTVELARYQWWPTETDLQLELTKQIELDQRLPTGESLSYRTRTRKTVRAKS